MEKAKVCKHNMKLYPFFRMLSYDFLFFYTIDFLFLTQIKSISPAKIILVDSFYAIFGIIWQLPASVLVEKTSRKFSTILGNLLNCIYILLIILSKNFYHLLIAECVCSFGFALKDTATPALLNESIPETTKRGIIFAKLNGKAISGYYVLNAISLVISGFLFSVNGYLPISICFAITILCFLISLTFIEPIKNKDLKVIDNNKENTSLETEKKELSLREAFKYIRKSGRLKSLILFGSLMSSFIAILASTQVYLVEELEISSGIIGIIFAFLGIVSAVAAKKQDKFQEKFKNKSLTILSLAISISIMASTIGYFLGLPVPVTLAIVIICFAIKSAVNGIYQVLILKYLSNFANEEVDSKIYAIELLAVSIVNAILGTITSFIFDNLSSYLATFILGTSFLVLFALTILYMKNRLGLKPEEYSKEETKYAKEAEKVA